VADHGGGLIPALVQAPAKLTVSLRVTGVRADGYHLIDAEMVTLDVHDDLEISDGTGLQIVGNERLSADDDNLVARALRAVHLQAHVRLTKRIPAGGGLGGGSADAGAILRWAGCADLQLAASLGADVPFCVVGGRARVRGIGEIIEPMPYVARTFTLVTPPFGVSTPAVYRRWDDLGGPTNPAGVNDLEPAALSVEPQLLWWRDEITIACGTPPTLAGSGATWFVDGDVSDRFGAERFTGATITVAHSIR
jgi:4-diphosphocytidyl-2-C-methyl-D-erythritol kinase